MSTKTSFKRVSAIAALALAVGGFTSITAANAAATESAATLLGNSYSTSGTGTNAVSQAVGGIAQLVLTETSTAGTAGDNLGTITSTGQGIISGASVGTLIGVYGFGTSQVNPVFPGTQYSLEAAGAATATLTGGEAITLTLTSATAGTQTVSFTPIGANGIPGTAVTATITWGAAPTASAQFSQIGTASTQTLDAAYNAGTLANPSVAVSGPDTYATPVAYVVAHPRNNLNGALASEKLSYTITGPGILALGSAVTVTAGVATVHYAAATDLNLGGGRALTGAAGQYEATVFGDGVPGTATLTVTDGTVVIGTTTIVFTGSPSKVTATQNLKVLAAGGVADYSDGNLVAGDIYGGDIGSYYAVNALTSGAGTVLAPTTSASKDVAYAPITVHTTDSIGNPVALSGLTMGMASTAIKVVVSDPTVLTAGYCTTVTSSGSASDTNEINCVVTGTVGAASGASATATVELWDGTTSAWDIVAAPLTFTIGGAVTKEVVTTDASSYVPNAPMTVTVTATDKSGNAAYDQDGSLIATSKSSTYMNGLLGGLPTHIFSGVGASTGIYAPLVEGDFTVSGVDGLSVAGEAVSVTATVAGFTASTASNAAADAAAEATDAANAATDAANAAADSADQATAAAQDAGSKADAALAAVTALSQQVTTLLSKIAALTTAVAKIAKKVKA